MYLGGAGGTGKSHVIAAVTEFFNRCGEGRHFRLMLYMEVAARNIASMSLHSALNLNQCQKKAVRVRANEISLPCGKILIIYWLMKY